MAASPFALLQSFRSVCRESRSPVLCPPYFHSVDDLDLRPHDGGSDVTMYRVCRLLPVVSCRHQPFTVGVLFGIILVNQSIPS